MQLSNLANAPSFSVFHNTSRCETNLLSKQVISRAELIITKWEIFGARFFPEYLLLPSYKYFLLTILFLVSYFLKINAFSAQLLFQSFSSRISNYSKYALFRSDAYSEQLLFQKRHIFRGRYFLKKSLFLIVLRNQFHSI